MLRTIGHYFVLPNGLEQNAYIGVKIGKFLPKQIFYAILS